MRKPQCRMDSCTRKCFGTEDVCLHHFRLHHFFAQPDPEPAAAHLRPSLTDTKQVWVDYAVTTHGWDRARCNRAIKSDLMTAVVKHEQLADAAKQRDTAVEQSPQTAADEPAVVEVDLES